jgi:Beta-lactamase associated winged helix domain
MPCCRRRSPAWCSSRATGIPSARDPAALIARYQAHRAEREAQVLDAIGAGAVTVASIAARVYPEVMPALRAAAEMTVRAHVDKLESDGRVAEDTRGLMLR